ncbi:capsule biosynthesis protein CapJ, partial [Staphylococcus haemolyticus]
MKLLFVHDFPAEFYKGDYYSMGFPYSIWERYLSIFDEMIISSRFKSSKDIIEKKQSSGKKVEFRPITSYKS